MPSSRNRRRVEIPTALYERVEERADRVGMTTTATVAALLDTALTTGSSNDALAHTAEVELVQELRGLRTGQDALAEQVRDLRQSLRSVLHLPRMSDVRALTTPTRVPLDASLREDLTPEIWEYLQLLVLIDLTQSPQLREAYVQQLAAARPRLPALTMFDPTDTGPTRGRDAEIR